MWFKLCLLVLVCILMIVVNTGGIYIQKRSHDLHNLTCSLAVGPRTESYKASVFSIRKIASVAADLYTLDYTSHAFTPGWKPVGYTNVTERSVSMSGVDDSHFGINDSGGRFFAFL